MACFRGPGIRAPAGDGAPPSAPPTGPLVSSLPSPAASPARVRSRTPWAQRLRRVLFVDALACPRCSTPERSVPLVVLAFLTDPAAALSRHAPRDRRRRLAGSGSRADRRTRWAPPGGSARSGGAPLGFVLPAHGSGGEGGEEATGPGSGPHRPRPLVEQFDDYVVGERLVRGLATLGESIADLGGIVIAYDALRRTDQYREGRTSNGLTPDQRFFLGYALAWMGSLRPETLARQIMTDVHAPQALRVNGPLSNLPELYAAFGVRPGDPMYRGEKDRVRIR